MITNEAHARVRPLYILKYLARVSVRALRILAVPHVAMAGEPVRGAADRLVERNATRCSERRHTVFLDHFVEGAVGILCSREWIVPDS